MLFDPAFATEIKSWLTAHLEPICDADPEVLADYVVALLKNDSDAKQMEDTLNDQLQDFLAENTSLFAKQTVEMLAKRAYMPASSSKAIPSGPSADARSTSGKKRRASSDDGRMDDDAAGAKTMRAAGGENDAWSSRKVSGRQGQGIMIVDDTAARSGNRAQQAKMHVPAGMCRDFHVRGFCARGDSCKFTHLTPGATPPVMAPRGPAGHPPSRPQNGDVDMASGDAPRSEMGGMPQPTPEQMQQMAAAFGFPGMPMMPNMDPSMFGLQGMPPSNGNMFNPNANRGGMGGGRGGRGGGRGTFAREPRSQTTLVIEHVPREHLDLIQVNDRFKRFGTITNIQIDKSASKALVSFSSAEEARRAHTDPDVIFGSRFVKVYYQKLDEQNLPAGDSQQRATSSPGGSPHPNSGRPSFQSGPRKITTEADVKMFQADAKAKQTSLNSLLEEQKTLMGGISTMDADKKKDAMNRLRELGIIIPTATQQAKDAAEKLQNVGPVTPLPESARALMEKAKKKQLDRELEAMSQRPMEVDERPRESEGVPEGQGQTTEELKAKLESLKAEAASIGLDASGAPAGEGARGRGRGRFPTRAFAPRGRGGYPRGFASLDNRPKELHIEAQTENGEPIDGERREKVEAWLKGYGEITNLSQDADGNKLIVSWKSRHEGDKAVWSGGNVPDVGKLKMQWAPQSAPAAGAMASDSGSPAPTSAENGAAN